MKIVGLTFFLCAILAVSNSIRIVEPQDKFNVEDTANTTVVTATCYYNTQLKSYSIKMGVIDSAKGTAWAMFVNETFSTGWATLYIETASGSTFSDDSKMYCSGE